MSFASNGNFTVVWQSNGSSGTDSSTESTQGQRYAWNGTPLGGQFQVNTYTTSSQTNPVVSSGSDGGFVVVWWSDGSFGTDSSDYSVQGQRYNSNGSHQGVEFQINTFTTNRQKKSAVSGMAQ